MKGHIQFYGYDLQGKPTIILFQITTIPSIDSIRQNPKPIYKIKVLTTFQKGHGVAEGYNTGQMHFIKSKL